MKASFAILFLVFTYSIQAQSYVDSGIRHYIANEYEEALVDFEEADKLTSLFTEFAISKLHFYRGMSLYKIYGADPKLEMDMIRSIVEDLTKAVSIDSSWNTTAKDVFDAMYTRTLDRSEQLMKQARKLKEREERVAQTNEYIDVLQFAFEIRKDPKVELMTAEAYHEIGDLYFEDSNNVMSLQKAGANYQKAIEFYEIARYDDPFSKEIINALLELSQRMDDPNRVEEYTGLLKLAGG